MKFSFSTQRYSTLHSFRVNMPEEYACQECAEKCLMIHRKNRNPSSIVTSFFKVVLNDRFLKSLPVPPRFASRLASLVGGETRIADSSGRSWIVTLSTVNRCVAFESGWDAFSVEHGIELGDILIFHYILNSHFIVQIYGRSGCEKLILPSEYNKVQLGTTANGPCNTSDKDSELCLATIPSISENLDDPCLMLVGRDVCLAGEEERIPFFDLFAPEIHNAGNVEKGNDSCNGGEDVMKNTNDANETREGYQDLEMDVTQIENATGLEVPKQLSYVASSGDEMILDYDVGFDDSAFDDLWGDALNVKMGETSENVENNFNWTSEIDYVSSVATKDENGILKTNSPDLPLIDLNEDEGTMEEVHIFSGHHHIDAHENLNSATNSGEVRQIVKTEHADYTQLQVLCKVTPNSESFLEIPTSLLSERKKVEQKVVILGDSGGRRWPVFYYERNGLNALGYGWRSFGKANGIQSGDVCVFSLEDQSDSLYRVQIIDKSSVKPQN